MSPSLLSRAQEHDGQRTFKILVHNVHCARGPIGGKETTSESKLCALPVAHGYDASACRDQRYNEKSCDIKYSALKSCFEPGKNE